MAILTTVIPTMAILTMAILSRGTRNASRPAVSPRSGRTGFTPLHAACEAGDGAAVGALF
eukprot:scaffold42538_cov49-Phaeocystis_antarctica.AAC.4